MKHSGGAARKARMTRQLNAITLGLAVSGTAATGVLMVSAAANSPRSAVNKTSADSSETTGATDDDSDAGSLQPARQAVTTSNSLTPVATSGGS